MAGSTERAVLAGGCFWGVQDLFAAIPGSSRRGWAIPAGRSPMRPFATTEITLKRSIEITFDPAQISYRTLLEFFFHLHDPTTRNRQGNDVGASYRSANLLHQ
jgi:peptide-methionine (S)-S-oxide reductase